MNELEAIIADKNQEKLILLMKGLLESEWAVQKLINCKDPIISSFIDTKNMLRQILSQNLFCDGAAGQTSSEFQASVDPFSKYYKINFCGVLDKNQSNDLIRLEQQIKKYTKDLYLNFIPYSYFKLREKREKKEPIQISFKQFASLNINLNVFSMMQAIYQQYISPKNCSPQQKNKLKQWLLIVSQRELSSSIEQIKRHFPESKEQKDKLDDQVKQMKSHLKNIDRRQNEEYDFFIINKILYENPEKLIIKTIKKVYQISNKNFRLNKESNFTLEDEIIKVNSLIFDQSTKKPIEKLNFEDCRKNEVRQITKQERQRYQLQPLRKLRKILQVSGQTRVLFLDSMLNREKGEKQPVKSAEVLRILMKFIENLLETIEHPQYLTKLRSYPYKNYENRQVYPNETLNSRLYDQIIALRNQIKHNKINQLKAIKDKLFQLQKQAIFNHFDNFPKPQHLLERQLSISKQIYKATFQTTFLYLQKLIELIIQAGIAKNQDGATQYINLVTFNVGDLFRARKSVSVDQFKNIVNAIYQLQNPIPDSSLPPQQYFRILRIKDKTDQSAKGILLNYIFKNAVQCQLQINTKSSGNMELYEVNHLLYELLRGQFGVISEMMTIIATKYNAIDHQALILKQPSKNNDSKQHADISRSIKQTFGKNNKQLLFVQSQDEQAYWTKVFQQKQQLKVDLQLMQAKKQKRSRIESLINPSKQKLKKIRESKQRLFIKTIVVNSDQNGSNVCSHQQFKDFICAYNIILNGFSSKNGRKSNIIKDIKFINRFTLQYLKQLDLSHNQIDDISHLFKTILFQNLKILNLSHNKLKGTIKFPIGWFPKLEILNLKHNNFEKFEFGNYFPSSKQNQLTIDQHNINNRVFDKCLSISKKQADQKWFKINLSTQIQRIKVISSNISLDINLDNSIEINKDIVEPPIQQQPEKDPQKFPYYPSSKKIAKTGNKNNPFQTEKRKLNDAIILHRINTKKTPKKQSSNFELSSKYRKISQYKQNHSTFFQQLAGMIVKKTGNSYKRKANCIRLKNIIIAPAHSIILQQQKKKWLNPSTHPQMKKQIMQRTFFERIIANEDRNYYSFKEIWIPQSYLIHNGDKYNDICLLLLQKEPQQHKQAISDIKMQLVYRQNNQTNFSCFLSASVFVYLQGLQNYCSSFADIKYSGSDSFIQLKNTNFQDGTSGSAVVYIEITGKKSCNCYLLGMFNSKNGDSKGYAANFNTQFKKVYEDMAALQTQEYSHKISNIAFQNFSSFRQRLSTITSLQNVIKQQKNQLILVKKILQLFAEFLERYLFLQQNQKDDFLLKVFIYNFTNGGDSYQADLRGIKLKFILEDLTPKQFTDLQQCTYYSNLEQKQNYTAKILLSILQKVRDMSSNKQANQIIQFLSNFIDDKLANCKDTNPLSLFKILLFLINILTYKNISEIKSSLQDADNKELQDPSYFSMINILINLISLKRIGYYAEMVRCSKDVPRFFFISNDPTGITNTDLAVNSTQELSTKESRKIKIMNITYKNVFEKIKEIIQSANVKAQQFEKIMHRQLFQRQITKVCMLQTLKNIYEQKPTEQLLQIFNKVDQKTIFQKIIETLNTKIKALLQRQFKESYLLGDIKQIKASFLNSIEDEFKIACFYYEYIITLQQFNNGSPLFSQLGIQSKLSPEPSFSKSNSVISRSNIHSSKNEQTGIFNSHYSDKILISTQGHNETSLTEYETLMDIEYDHNRQIYQNHIGAICVLDEQIQDRANNYLFFGTGALISKRTVLTAAHVLTNSINGTFKKGKFIFRLTKTDHKLKKIQEAANVIQIRLVKNSDIALLLLDNDLIQKPIIKLVTHTNISKKSNFKGRKYFCQIIGHITTDKLQKSQGCIFIQDSYLSTFNYSLPTDNGQSGGVILFFPTGNYKQPYILGIHTEGYSEAVNFNMSNGRRYVNQKFNSGRKIRKDEFSRDNKAVAIYVTDGYQVNQQILRYESIHQNSYIFSDLLYHINVWKLIYQINEHLFSNDPDKKYGLLYRQYQAYIDQSLKFIEMSPQNLLCYETKSFHTYFGVIVNYLDKNQVSGTQQDERQQSKLFLEQVINSYHRHIQAFKIVEQYLEDLQQMRKGHLSQAILKFARFQEKVNNQFRQAYKISEDPKNIYRKQIQLKFSQISFFLKTWQKSENNLKNLYSLLKKRSLINTNTIITCANIKYSPYLNFSIYQQLQSQYFNDEQTLSEYINCKISQTHQQDANIKDIVIQYIIIRATCQIINRLFLFYFQSRIKLANDRLQTFTQYQLCRDAYSFKPPSQNYSSPSSAKQFYKKELNHRKSAIFCIQKISNLSQTLRQQQIEKILNWSRIQNYVRQHFQQFKNKIPYYDVEQVNAQHDAEEIEQIIVDIYQKYHYLASGHYHYINIGRIVYEEIAQLRDIVQRFSFSKLK